jgi:tRNA-guanine family transglycosylase
LRVAPREVLELQLDLGGNIIATLDYPLPQTLKDDEAQERIGFSIENSIETLRLLQHKNDETTKVFIPIHGRTPEEIQHYINKFVMRYKRSKLDRPYDGFAVGSLVPLRTKPDQIIAILSAVKKTLAEKDLDHLPIHVFGVGSTLIPYLVYLGFDTFDSSTYVQKARNLQYSHPETWANQRATGLQEIVCQCETCLHLNLAEMLDVLKSDASFQSVGGRFKSEFYAQIATHNLNLHIGALKESIKAAEEGRLEDYLLEFANKRFHQGNPIAALAAEFPEFKKKVGRTLHPVVKPKAGVERKVSLKYKPSDFTIPEKYKVPKGEKILFLFPCSKEKPYSESQTYKRISTAVHAKLNGTSKKIHFVVVSGLYGPVPLKYDDLPETCNYDFVLTFRNQEGIKRVGDRLAQYVKDHGDKFEHVVAFAASKPYREAIMNGLNGLAALQMFPKHKSTSGTGRTVQFQKGLEECLEFLAGLEKKGRKRRDIATGV